MLVSLHEPSPNFAHPTLCHIPPCACPGRTSSSCRTIRTVICAHPAADPPTPPSITAYSRGLRATARGRIAFRIALLVPSVPSPAAARRRPAHPHPSHPTVRPHTSPSHRALPQPPRRRPRAHRTPHRTRARQ
ncbi:hypothetical protein HYPSUDRAFT_34762 [Hypholoma sublateritium FD-334 SS-4]|uniref:Uncharacterized protein n=1 Tax=Hypholoma sublateritium (strain FD-334 SS-4) TaxID=945553 RepID=A0A0D2Q7E1_HYPSF|nr:hypothetical protein HYPSUDRAFT_34762 [Hypholoma sublateritium FD-334 SS-4]